MDSDASVFVRPADVFTSPADTAMKSPPNSFPTLMDEGDDKFVRYDSSPESMISYTDDTTFSPIEDDLPQKTTKLLDMAREYLGLHHANLDHFTTFPVALDQQSERLLATYLTDYAGIMYGFSPSLRPNPTATALSIAMANPASFHLILARSAQFQLSWSRFHTAREQRELEVALMKHKGEAIRVIRHLSSCATEPQQIEDLLLGVISLGTLDRHCEAYDTAALHFGTARQLLKSIGGPKSLQAPWFSRLMLHFECGYGSPTQSSVWDQSDFGRLHAELNRFFHSTWLLRRSSPTSASSKIPPLSRRGSVDVSASKSTISTRNQRPRCGPLGLKPNTYLHNVLSRKPVDLADPSSQDRTTLIFQLTCLFTLAAILNEQTHVEPEQSENIEARIDSIHDHVASVFSSTYQPVNDILWSLQIHDLSPEHTQRTWRVAGWVWILRHVSFNVQDIVRDWLIAVLTGKPVARALKLDSFAFSYTC